MKFFRCILILLLTLSFSPATVYAQGVGMDPVTFDDDFDLEEDWDMSRDPEPADDPFNGYNRFMFKVNDTVYEYVFTPISRVYDTFIPKPLQSGINNISRFLGTPVRLGNSLLQTKYRAAWNEFQRFLINGTLGIAGLIDVARITFEIEQHNENFAQTLGHYGVPPGPYIIWPILGPSDPRDTVGMIGDMAMNPLFWLNVNDGEPEEMYEIYPYVVRVNNYSYNIRDAYERILHDAFDEYIALRQVYIQNRDKRIKE